MSGESARNEALLARYDRGTVEKSLPEFPITTLRRLQSLYGRLDYLRRGVTDFEGYQPYLSTDHIGEEAMLVCIDMDLTGEQATLHDVSRIPYDREDHGDRLGYSYYYASMGHDFSIAHRTTTGSENSAGNWAAKTFTKWAFPEEAPQYDPAIVDDHPDGWIIERLREVDPTAGDEDTPSLKDHVMDAYDTSAEETVLVVRFLLPAGEVETVGEVDESDDPTLYWPGELDICMAIMRSAKLRGYKTKSDVEGTSEGQGVDQNTGKEATLVGFASDPLKHFLQFQREKFSGFDPKTAWQSHPISEQEALYLDESGDFLEACYSSLNNHRIYQFPYFAERVDPEQANALYELLQRLQAHRENEERRESTMGVLRAHARELGVDIDSLRFWIVLQQYDQKDRRNVFREISAARYQTLDELAETHLGIVNSPLVGQWGLPQPAETLEDDDDRTPPTQVRPFIVDGASEDYVRNSLASGWYLSVALPRVHAGTEDNPDPALDDPVTDVYRTILSGGQVGTETLLSLFMERLNDDISDAPGVFRYLVTMQSTILQALASTGQLRPTDETQTALCQPPMTDDNTPDPTDVSEIDLDPESDPTDTEAEATAADRAAYRKQRLNGYIERDPSLQDSPERQAAFRLGFYTGLMSNYQAAVEDMDYTIDKQYSPENLSREGAMRLYSELVAKSRQYISGGTLYGDVASELTETIRTPTEWDLSLVDLRFTYARGLMFGLSHRSGDTPVGLGAEGATDQTNAVEAPADGVEQDD